MTTMRSFIKKYWIALLICIVPLSCSKDLPTGVESNGQVVLKSIKIINVGEDGTQEVEGEINENKKTVTFPSISPETDLSSIEFVAEVSDGGKLDKEYYDFSIDEDEFKRSKVVKVENGERYREYLVTIKILVPVFGADFEKPQYYDFSNNDQGEETYPTFSSLLTRGSGFDGEHVLIVTRASEGPHLLKYSDLKNGRIKPIALNTSGVEGGIFPYNTGDIVNGHSYVFNLSGGIFSIYHWANPEDAPDVTDIDLTSISGAGDRYGDNMSVNLDKDGNGYMYFGDNTLTSEVDAILRLNVSNYTNISEPKILSGGPALTAYMSFNQIGDSENYLMTGYEAPIRLVNKSGEISYTLDESAIPIRASDARVAEFNEERYLIATTAARGGDDAVVLYVYDITKGNDIEDALDRFSDSNREPVFKYSLKGPANAAPSTQTNWHVFKDKDGKDDKLVLYAASADAGFVLIEFPKKKMEE